MIDGGDGAERNAEQRGKQQGRDGQLQRRRQPLLDVERHRPARIGALAEIEARHLAQIDGELHVERLVEAVLAADLGDLGGRGVLARERGGRIGRHHADQEEGQHQQAGQRRDHQQQTAQDEAEHAGGP